MSQTVFNMSFTDSIIPLFLSSSLWFMGISLFFMLFLMPVTSWSPFLNKLSNAFWLMNPLSANASPRSFSNSLSIVPMLLSATFPLVNITFTISPNVLTTKNNLNPKNHPVEVLPLSANPLKTLLLCMRLLLQALIVVESA